MSVCFRYNGELLAVKRMAGLKLLPSFLQVKKVVITKADSIGKGGTVIQSEY